MSIDEYADKQRKLSEDYPWMNKGRMIYPIDSVEMIRARQSYFFTED